MKYIGIIPARFQSSRFPGKPLCRIGEKTMIEHVYTQVRKVTELERVIVATDHPDIEACVRSFGGEVCMTSTSHRSGTDRCAEVYRNLSEAFPAKDTTVINIQGDEPFIQPGQIQEIIRCMENSEAALATLLQIIDEPEMIANPNVVKATRSIDGYALYFSRFPIPYLRSGKKEGQVFYKHIGMYAYRADVLQQIVALPASSLETAESLEQLRWLENGFRIATGITEYQTSISIDTPDDLKKAIAYEKQIHP